MCRHIVGLKQQGLSKSTDGAGQVAILSQCRSQVVVSACIFGVMGNGLSEFRNRIRKIALLHERCAQPVVGLRGRGAELHRALEGFESMCVVVAIPKREPQFHIKLGIVRMSADLFLNLADRTARILNYLCRCRQQG